MKFTQHTFSKRFPPIECSVFVMHEPAAEKYRATAAAIITERWIYVGVAVCSPMDKFIKATGRSKALGRAYQHVLNGHAGKLAVALQSAEFVPALKAALTEAVKLEKARMMEWNDKMLWDHTAVEIRNDSAKNQD